MRVKWAAIMVATIADWLLGGVWFQVFAKQWQAGQPMAVGSTQAAHPNYWPFLVALVSSFVMAYAIARVVAGSDSPGLFRGIVAGVLVGLAAAAAMFTEMVFEIRPGSFILIASGYPLVGSILMGIIIGVWRHKAGPDTEGPASAK